MARVSLWLALFVPFVYSTAKTSGQVQLLNISVLDMVRGGGPFLLIALSVILRPRVTNRRVTPTHVLLFVFVAVTIASTAWSVLPHATILKALTLLGSYLALTRLVALYPSAEETLRGLATTVHVVLLVIAVNFVVVPGSAFRPNGLYDESKRLFSVVPQIDPNTIGFLATVGLLGVMLRVGPDWVMRRLGVRLFLGALYVVELLASRTRTALLLCVLLSAVAFVAMLRRWQVLPYLRARPWLLAAVTLAPLAVVAAGVTLQAQTLTAYLLRGQALDSLLTLTGRTNSWQAGLDAWADHRFLGLGYYAGHRVGLGDAITDFQTNLDSTWVETLVDVGLLGLVPLVGAVVTGVVAVARLKVPGLRLWTLMLVSYGLLISFVNPTIQAPGTSLILVLTPLLAAATHGEVRLVSGGHRRKSLRAPSRAPGR